MDRFFLTVLMTGVTCLSPLGFAEPAQKPGSHATETKSGPASAAPVTWSNPDSYSGDSPLLPLPKNFDSGDAHRQKLVAERNLALIEEAFSLLQKVKDPANDGQTDRILKLFAKYYTGRATDRAAALRFLTELTKKKGQGRVPGFQKLFGELGRLLMQDKQAFEARFAEAKKADEAAQAKAIAYPAGTSDGERPGIVKANMEHTADELADRAKPATKKRDETLARQREEEIRDKVGRPFGFVDWDKPCEQILAFAEAFRENDFTHPAWAHECQKSKIYGAIKRVAEQVEGEVRQLRQDRVKQSLAYRTAYPSEDDVNPPLIPSEEILKKMLPKKEDYEAVMKKYDDLIVQYRGIRLQKAIRDGRNTPLPESPALQKKIDELEKSGRLRPKGAEFIKMMKSLPVKYQQANWNYARAIYAGPLADFYKKVGLSPDGFDGSVSNRPDGQLQWCLGQSLASCEALAKRLKPLVKKVKDCKYEGSALAKRFPAKTDVLDHRSFPACTTREDLLKRLDSLYDTITSKQEEARKAGGRRKSELLKDLGYWKKERDGITRALRGREDLEAHPEALDRDWEHMKPDQIKTEAKKYSATDLDKAAWNLDKAHGYERTPASRALRAAMKEAPSAKWAKELEEMSRKDPQKVDRILSQLSPGMLRELKLNAGYGLRPRIDRALEYPRLYRELLNDKKLGPNVLRASRLTKEQMDRMWAIQEARDRAEATDHNIRLAVGLQKGKKEQMDKEIARAFDEAIKKISALDKIMPGASMERKRAYYKKFFKPQLGFDDKGKVMIRIVPTDELFKLQLAQGLMMNTEYHADTGLWRRTPLRFPQTPMEAVAWWTQLKDKQPKMPYYEEAGLEDATGDMFKVAAVIVAPEMIGLKTALEVGATFAAVGAIRQGAQFLDGKKDFRNPKDWLDAGGEVALDFGTGVAFSPLIVMTPGIAVPAAVATGSLATYEDIKEGAGWTALVDGTTTFLAAKSFRHLGARGKPIDFSVLDEKVAFGKWEGGGFKGGKVPEFAGQITVTPEGKIGSVAGRASEMPKLKALMDRPEWKNMFDRNVLWEGLSEAELGERFHLEKPEAHIHPPEDKKDKDKEDGKNE